MASADPGSQIFCATHPRRRIQLLLNLTHQTLVETGFLKSNKTKGNYLKLMGTTYEEEIGFGEGDEALAQVAQSW